MVYYTASGLGGMTIIIRDDGGSMTSFAEDEANADFRAYQEWLAEGNTPKPWPPAES